MLEYKPWLVEPPLFEIPWRQEIVEGAGIPEKLCIAVLWDDGVVAPHPPILDSLKRTKDALLAAGHEVIDWEAVEHQHAWDLIVSNHHFLFRESAVTLDADPRCSHRQCKLYFLDGGDEYRQILEHDPPVPQTQWILDQVPNKGAPFSVPEIFALNREREAFRTRLLEHWAATRLRTSNGRVVDAILAPVAPTLAPPHDTTRWWGYTAYWNLLDYPGVVFPAGRFDAGSYRPIDVSADVTLPEQPRNTTEEYVRAQWNPDTYHNASIGLQLVGRRLNEERLLGILQKVEEAVRHPEI